MTLSDVARQTGMSPATARRSLHTLVALGYVRLVDRRFVLSARVLTLGAAYLKAANIEELVQPELRRIVGKFGDAASVAVLEDTDILYIAHYSPSPTRTGCGRSSRKPAGRPTRSRSTSSTTASPRWRSRSRIRPGGSWPR